MKPSTRQSDLRFSLDYDESLPERLIGYRLLLFRVILNLLGNAVKFSSEGKLVSLFVGLIEIKNNLAKIQIKISDEGIGIPPDKLQVIFEPFERLTPAYQGKYKGSGLGLYMVKQYLQKMKGQIQVESTENKGSIFTCTLSLQIANETLPSAAPTSSPSSFSPLQQPIIKIYKESSQESKLKPEILLVEDDLIAQKITVLHLLQRNLIVDIAGTSEEAVHKASRKNYALILMDLGLPDQNGYLTTESIHRVRQKANQPTIPVVALTAHADLKKENLSLEVGIARTLKKPLRATDLDALIYDFITNRSNAEVIETPDKIIDLELGAQLAGGSLDVAEEILNILVAELPQQKHEMELLYEEGSLELLQEIVHKLYGRTCYCGVPRLRKVAAQLKSALQQNNRDKIEVYYQDVLAEIKAILQLVQ